MAEDHIQLHHDPVELLRLPSGVELACRVVGDGPIPLVFVHGYAMSLDSWERVLDLLPEDFTAYAYDLRGFGRSGAAESYTLEDHAADLLAFMDSLALARAALIGHSLGANIGQMTLVGAPDRVSAFVMCNGVARNLPHPDPIAGRVEERIAAYGTIEDNRRVVSERMGLYFDPDNLTAEEMRRFIEIGAGAKTEALRQTLHGLYSHPVLGKDDFDGYRGPALILGAENDRMTPMTVAGPLRAVLPQAEAVTIAKSGHSPMWERPREWSAVVYRFLGEKLAVPAERR